uniref:AlNc14C106G6232 protein n=1 Tax=Albugo laibachii Nc14 TaxID=890382 RepID=F0WI25_9STRA|nr:AlNc14C106G6232 [Albugo laibachii Nc14]|eukprot:CCA20903.1 AlNc14C106G6232 [Albugo laibachii Nc14]
MEITHVAGLLRLLQFMTATGSPSQRPDNRTQSLGKGLSGSPTTGAQIDDIYFWIDLTSVKLYFDSIFMCWNSDLFYTSM